MIGSNDMQYNKTCYNNILLSQDGTTKRKERSENLDIDLIQNKFAKDVYGLVNDERFDKLLVLKDEGEFFACGELFSRSISKKEKIERFQIAMNISHKHLLPLYGFDISQSGQEVFEIRKINFEPLPLTKQVLSDSTMIQRYKLLSQMIEFFNYIISMRFSFSMQTLDDVISCCFLDCDFNLYFGNISFIHTDFDVQKSIFSIGVLVFQLLNPDVNIKEDFSFNDHVFNDETPQFWQKFIKTCINDQKFDISAYKDDFINLYYSQDTNDNILDVEDDYKDVLPNERKIEKIFIPHNFDDVKSVIDKYQSMRCSYLCGQKDERFEHLKAEINEEGRIVFIQTIKDQNKNETINNFLLQIELVHPMILPLKGFCCTDPSLMKLYIYRESCKDITTASKLDEASDDRKIKWIRQIIDFTSFIIEETNYQMIETYLYECAALDQEDNLIFVNLKFLKASHDENRINETLKCFLKFIPSYFLKADIPSYIFKIRRSISETGFYILKAFFADFDPTINWIESEVHKYLEDYYVHKEIEGHQCHVTIYKRNLISSKNFRQLVLKRYSYVFTEKLMEVLNSVKENIIKVWTTERESFILMRFVKSDRLRDLIPLLNYEQKITILKNILKKIKSYYFHIIFGNLSINNIYIDKDFNIFLLDCIFVVDDSDDVRLAPEVSHISSIKYWEIEKVDIYSVGIIAYEMFGGILDSKSDFDFQGIPIFIQNFVRVCCNKKAIERPSIYTLLKRLKKYQEPDVERLFQFDFIEVSQYFFDPDDLYKTVIGERYGHLRQKSTKKYLIEKDPGTLFGDVGTEKMRCYIISSQCRNSLPIYGFSYDEKSYHYYYEYFGEWIFPDTIGRMSFDNNKKLDIIQKLVHFYIDMLNHGYTAVTCSDMVFDNNRQLKISPGLQINDIHRKKRSILIRKDIKEFARIMCEAFGGKYYDNPETPSIIQALIWRIHSDKSVTLNQVGNVIDGMNEDLSQNDPSDICVTYESKTNPDLVEGGIRAEILMRCSDLVSYSRNDNEFSLFFKESCDHCFIDYLHDLENISIVAFKKKMKLKDFVVDHEYRGKQCIVQFLVKGEEKRVLKRYYKNIEKQKYRGRHYLIEENFLEIDGKLAILQEYRDIETLEDCIKRGSDFIDNEFIKKLIYDLINIDHGFPCRYSPHNICLSKDDHKIVVVDTIDLNSSNYEDLKDEFVAPECSKLSELNKDDIKSAMIYSIGWIAFILFGLTPEIDENTKIFKPPTFPDGFPQFWKDFITLATRENTYDRLTRGYFDTILERNDSFEDIDFLVSSKILSSEEYEIKDPIAAGAEAIIYLATSKLTGEKHACKKLEYKIRSKEVKRILHTIENIDSSIFGIKYIGISLFEGDVYLHMEYVPNGSLSEAITLDRRMLPPPWFSEMAKIRLAKEIAEGMRSLHEHGIIHKDLKPENILLDENNSAKICDFSFIPEAGAETPFYMAPELFNGKEATFKSDVYSFAVTLVSLFGGGDMIVSAKKAASGGFRPSIAAGTPPSIQSLIRKCWQQNPDDRPTFSEIVDELENADVDDFDMRIDSMEEFELFDPNKKMGILSESLEYEMCDITGDVDEVEHLIRLHTTIQPDNILQIRKYCLLNNQIVLILEKLNRTTFEEYLKQKKKISQTRGKKFISDFISLFKLYHKNRFYFGPFSLKRLFFRDKHRSSICFDIFAIPGLSRPQADDESMISPPGGFDSREGDVFAFACFVLKIFGCFSLNSDGSVSKKPFKRSSKAERQPIPLKYQNIIMERCLSEEPMTRPTFELLFKKLFPVQYKIISTFLSVSVSRFSTFSMKNDFEQEEIVFMETLGSGTFGNVIHAFNKTSNADLAVKEFNDSLGAKNEDFMLEYVALKAIDHPNIIKILGASQRKEQVHGSRLFMEFASLGDLDKNMGESFEIFVAHLLQISSAMKYLHQREIIHFDLKPKNILIRGDGSAVVADFNTAMHVDIDTHLSRQRGSENYMSPEIRRGEKYSYQTDVFSFGLMAAEYFSRDAFHVVKEANEKHERPVLDFISDKRMRSLIEFCVDDDPMSRPSFDFICDYLFKKFFKDTPRAAEFEGLTQIPRIDEDKLAQLRVLATRGSSEAIIEYGKYLLSEFSFSDAMYVFMKGASDGDPLCLNTLSILSKIRFNDKFLDDIDDPIIEAANKEDVFALSNFGLLLYRNKQYKDAIEILKVVYSKGLTYAGYFIGFIYENEEFDGMTFEERIEKAIQYYHDAAKEGDAFAQYKFGLCLEDGLTVDEDGFDSIHYFRQSAYQRCKRGVKKYASFLEGDRIEWTYSTF